jgi:type III restriction enzyme
MVRRVCRELGNKRNIVVINDEAHHCYRRKPDGEDDVKLKGEERARPEARRGGARLDSAARGGEAQARGEGDL